MSTNPRIDLPGPDGPSGRWIDGHLDLAWMALAGRDLADPADGVATAVSWPDLADGGIGAVFATIFTEMDGPADDPASYPGGDVDAAAAAGERQLAWYHGQAEAGRLRLVDRAGIAVPSRAGDPIATLLLMECADPIRNPDDAARWVEAGVSMVGLSWGRGSRYAGGNASPGGLTAEGRELVAALTELGVAFDVSHLSREAFEDLLDETTAPVCATHSNAATLVGDDPRHLTDDQLHALRARDAMVGLNLYGRFLRPDHAAHPASIEDALDHVEHAASIVGRHRVGLGSDADGGFPASDLPTGLRRLRALESLATGLSSRGWSDAEVAGFRGDNWRTWCRQPSSGSHSPQNPHRLPSPGDRS